MQQVNRMPDVPDDIPADFLKHIDPDDIRELRDQYVMIRWCPNCQQEYQTADGACPDCGTEGGPS